MDAIHIMLGQNGRPGRTETVPQRATGDVGNAFFKALAALEGPTPGKTAGDIPAPPEDGDPATDETTADGEVTIQGEEVEGDVPVESVPLEDLEGIAAVITEPTEEEFLPLAVGGVPATEVPADNGEESQIPAQRVESRSSQAAVFAFASTEPRLQAAQGQQGQPMQQQVLTAVPAVPADEAPSLPAVPGLPAAPPQSAPPVQPSGTIPFIAREGALVLPRGAVSQTSAPPEGEHAFAPDATHSTDEVEEVRIAPKAAGMDRHLLQAQPDLAAKVTATAPVEAKPEDGIMRLQVDGIGTVQIDSGLSQSRSIASAMPTPAAEARPIVNSIAEATIKAQNGTVELRLSPEELGRVRISMSHHEHGISVVLNVDRDDTLSLLRRHASELAAALREAGLGEATIEFANREQRSSPEHHRKVPGPAFGMLSDIGTETAGPILRAPGDGALDIRM